MDGAMRMNTIPLQRGLTGWKHVKSQAIERYFGAEIVENLSRHMRDFYWPIYVQGTNGWVYAMPGGDFVGNLMTNGEMSVFDRADAFIMSLQRAAQARTFRNKLGMNVERAVSGLGGLCYAFASDDAVLAAETGGKGQLFSFTKTGTASNAIGNAEDLWIAVGMPNSGAGGSAAPGGSVPDNTFTGAIKYVNPASAGTGHFRSAEVMSSVLNNTLLLNDRLFSVAKTMNSTATEAVTGVPTRYQDQVSTELDYIGGNFCYPFVPTTVLPATAHNWTVCQYTDQDGNIGNSFDSMTGVSACSIGGVDCVAQAWFLQLAAGDVGVKALTQMQCSALVATGTIDFVVAHPIAMIPCYAANVIWVRDALYGQGPRMPHIEDNACLSFLEMPKPATTATTYSGQLVTVAE